VNYRHVYHAGNFADVIKHVVLTLIIEHLKLKPAPFRLIDTHAGVGLYDLSSEQAQKTGEWRDGIGRLLAGPPLPPDITALLEPYLAVVRAFNPGGEIECYPGSPLIARRLMRPGDQLIANELHPDDAVALRHLLSTEPDSKAMALDGYVALRALLPPKERRGVVLIDPPFEVTDELAKLADAVADAKRRFATGTLLIWYPIKDPDTLKGLYRSITDLALPKAYAVEVLIRPIRRTDILNGCGLIIVNAPYTLEAAIGRLMPPLLARLGQDPGSRHRIIPLIDSTKIK
jgi:23S rRNA (adenine2030-N6)-methyltransferase